MAETLLSLPPDQFRAALGELQLGPEREADLMRQYRRANSAFAPVYGLLERMAAGDAGEGMARASVLPVARPEGMSVAEAMRSGQAQFAMPQGVMDAIGALLGGVDAPAAASQGLIPAQDMPMEALGAGGVAMGAGGLLSRPAGSVGMGGRVIDFAELRRQRARDRLIGVLQRAVDDVQSGNYQRRLDEAAFSAHQEGLLPLQVGTRVAPPQSYDMPGSWQISGYFVDPNNPRRFGYKLESDAGDTYDAIVSDPQLGLSLDDPTRFGGGFRAFAGPRGEALQYQNLPQAPQGAIGRDIDPSERARIDEEYRQLFGDDLSANRSTTTGLLASAASDTPAQRVARLLREGRAPEVTDDLMAQADPQEMYRLYVAGETGMDLPMDEASRMARAQEMGFDTGTPLYHGTGADFQAFQTRPGVLGDAAYFARLRHPSFQQEPIEMANSYANRRSGGTREVGGEGANIIQAFSEPSTPVRMIAQGLGEIPEGAVASDLRGPARAVFDPTRIRSRFARFDPRLSHLANLSAANVSPITGLLSILAAQQGEQ